MSTIPSVSRANVSAEAKEIPPLGERVMEAVREWRRRSRSRRELLMLSERDLRDVRLTRCDVMSEAHKPFWKQ